jgi:ABC-type nitrate/sulfonate/bicarbonate transport system substrate-binding protein/outer membrane protein OmpA-like peptidoglycan-associated protein
MAVETLPWFQPAKADREKKGLTMQRGSMPRYGWALALAGLLVLGSLAGQEQRFAELVGPGTVGSVTQTTPLQVPFITWGGDMATFYANGGLSTKPGSLFQKQGLNLKLAPADDFVEQVRDYRAGKSPFLRGTFHMVGLASEVIGSDPRTKGVVVLQLTWSAGDHMVAREHVKTLNDLKGKTVVLQQGGPHVGLLDDVLRSAQLTWNDLKVVWTKDLTGSADCPAELFRKRREIDACFAITPDMVSLCGGLTNTGTGAEGTVKGARVLVSTAQLSRSIADVYVCRKDFYDANKELVTKFVAGYLKACEEVIELKKKYETSGSDTYKALLQLTQDIYGKKTIPVLDDAHGLLTDCTFVGYPGNVAFFTQAGNLIGFEALHKAALDLAINRGYARERMGLFPSGLDYQSPLFLSYLTKTQLERGERFRAEAVRSEIELLTSGGALDDRTILSFTIGFEPNQNDFSSIQYAAEFQRVVETAARFGNAVIAIRGHADPTKTLADLVRAGMAKGVLKRVGTPGNYSYSVQGKPLDLGGTTELIKLVESGAFDGVAEYNPRETMQAALNLSRNRAEAVLNSVVEYAKGKGLAMDKTQVQPVGVGIREPFVAKPKDLEEAKKNMRVEFRVVRVPAEATKQADFDF